MAEITGKQVRLFTKKGHHYSGEILEETETHYALKDSKYQNEVRLAKDFVTELIVIEGAKYE